MSYMKEKYTEAQEALYSSYLKLLEARDTLLAKELREDDLMERYGRELTQLSSAIDFVIWLFEKTYLFNDFGLDELHRATYTGNKNESETKEEGNNGSDPESMSAMLKISDIFKKRNEELVAAYAASDKAFNEYRDRAEGMAQEKAEGA